MPPAEYETKLNAEAHIDELVQVSEDGRKGRPNEPDDNKVHGDFARDGWRYRSAYFMDHDGKYYHLTISVAHGRDGKVAYNIAEIKKRSFPEKNGSSNPKTGAQGKTSLDERVSQPDGEVKGKSSMRERDDAADVKTAEKYFGTTYKIAEAGYLLTDGKLLDFSGRHEGAPGGYRSVDHRDISDAFDGEYGDDSYTGGMIQFMQAGNIRLSPESGGINLSVKPNKQQLDTLDRYISSFRGEVILDIDNANGDTVVSVEYPKRTYSKRIIDGTGAHPCHAAVCPQTAMLAGIMQIVLPQVERGLTPAEKKTRRLPRRAPFCCFCDRLSQPHTEKIVVILALRRGLVGNIVLIGQHDRQRPCRHASGVIVIQTENDLLNAGMIFEVLRQSHRHGAFPQLCPWAVDSGQRYHVIGLPVHALLLEERGIG